VSALYSANFTDELFMHYFHSLSSASGGKGAQTPTGALFLDPLGYFCPETPNLPPLEKILWTPMAHRGRFTEARQQFFLGNSAVSL